MNDMNFPNHDMTTWRGSEIGGDQSIVDAFSDIPGMTNDAVVELFDVLVDEFGVEEALAVLTRLVGGEIGIDDIDGGTSTTPEPEVISGSARIWGDPHFLGADGGKYDIQGEAGKIYNLLSDDNFQMNGRFDAWGGNGATVVGEVGIVTSGGQIEVSKTGDVFVNNQQLVDGESVTMDDGTVVSKNGDSISVRSGEWEIDFTAKDSSRGEYLNIDIRTDNAVADGVKPHGLIGQTFDGDGEARNGDKGSGAQGGGAIDALENGQRTEEGDLTSVARYEADTIFDTEFDQFDRYDERLNTGGTSGSDDSSGSDDVLPPPPLDPIAGTARIWGDPHFIGADGGKYDIQGSAGEVYNLLSDSNFQMNGRFDAWGGNGATVVGEVGIVVEGGEIQVTKEGDLIVNGRTLRDGETEMLRDGTKVTKDGNTFRVEAEEWDVTMTLVDSSRGDYFNIDISTDNAVADGVKPHGLIGQSFDGDGEARNGDKGSGAQGGGAIEANETGEMTEAGDRSSVSAYVVDDIFDTEFDQFDRFSAGGSETTELTHGYLQAESGEWFADDIHWPIYQNRFVGDPSTRNHQSVDIDAIIEERSEEAAANAA